MQKLLIPIVCLGASLVTACSGEIPFVYRIDIQQGNVLTQENVNRLEPGMTKSQVQYIMGTPLVNDPFHADRWDYYHSMDPGDGKRTHKAVSLYFDGNKLARLEGDLRPDPDAKPDDKVRKTQVIDVTPHPEKKKGIFARLFGGSEPKPEADSDGDGEPQPDAPPPGSEPPSASDSPSAAEIGGG